MKNLKPGISNIIVKKAIIMQELIWHVMGMDSFCSIWQRRSLGLEFGAQV